jgi:plastocyanin
LRSSQNQNLHRGRPYNGAQPLFSQRWIRQILLTFAIAFLITAPAFQSSPRLVLGTSSTYAVAIIDYNFQPLHINITTGTTVVWTYANNGRDYHTVTSNPNTNKTQGSPLLNSGSLSPGQSFSYTFYQPGFYPYQCSFHPTIMNGWVNVTGAPITPPTSQNPQPDYTLIASVAGVVVLAIVATLVLMIRRRKRIPSTTSTSTQNPKT